MSFLGSLALSVLAPLATNFIGNLLGGGSKQTQTSQPAPIPQMTLAEATKQAGNMINPIYDQQVEHTLHNLDMSNVSRGFYGQMPGDALKMGRAADLEANRAGQVANLANQLMQQDQQYGLQQQAMNLQQQQMDLQQQQTNPFSFQNLLNTGLNVGNAYYNWTGQPIWQAFGGGPQGSGASNNPTWNQFMDGLKGTNLTYDPNFNALGAGKANLGSPSQSQLGLLQNTKMASQNPWVNPTLKF